MSNADYAALIKAVRNSKGIKAIFVAKKIGVSVSTYTELEAGRRQITVERAGHIAEAMGMTLPELLCHEVSDSLTQAETKTGTES